MKQSVILVGAILALGLTDSVAQGPPGGEAGDRGGRGGFRGRGGGNQLMSALDKNSDGTLDSREIQQAPLSLRELDTNKDFKLTPDELGTRGGGPEQMTQRLLEMDANKDGKLTADEMPERMQRFVERMDSNGDGAVDKTEMEQFQNDMRRRFEEGGGPERGDRGGRQQN